ncbi:hypothetical protein VN12_24655 [Pirellula sp. SH-Sr6A]|uniref:hypothetical protein n=1 Tax=Pirellula sp. SH-Sr6A TaxID=1632865 RepID=UPI00078C672D|nr:hypothetical protein [Pirellula sp. SH-Sr6A]AMV35340.1 hypothetical protein VN12_24655 [Pirellula sp. SH-Sr6A]
MNCRTWYVFEDDIAKMRAYVSAFADHLAEVPDDVLVLAVFDQREYNRLLNEAPERANVKLVTSRDDFFRIRNEIVNSSGPAIILLDILLKHVGTVIQDNSNFVDDFLIKVSQRESDCLVCLISSEHDGEDLLRQHPSLYSQVIHLEAVTGNEQAMLSRSKRALKSANIEWDRFEANACAKILSAIMNAQAIGQNPGHPNDFSTDVPNDFPFRDSFLDDGFPTRSFKSLFYFASCEGYDCSTQVIARILASCGVKANCDFQTSTKGRFRFHVPGGARFLFRLTYLITQFKDVTPQNPVIKISLSDDPSLAVQLHFHNPIDRLMNSFIAENKDTGTCGVIRRFASSPFSTHCGVDQNISGFIAQTERQLSCRIPSLPADTCTFEVLFNKRSITFSCQNSTRPVSLK